MNSPVPVLPKSVVELIQAELAVLRTNASVKEKTIERLHRDLTIAINDSRELDKQIKEMENTLSNSVHVDPRR